MIFIFSCTVDYLFSVVNYYFSQDVLWTEYQILNLNLLASFNNISIIYGMRTELPKIQAASRVGRSTWDHIANASIKEERVLKMQLILLY